MKRPSLWTRLRYSYFAKPVHERPLYKAMLHNTVSQVVEIGMGDCDRAERLIRLALKLYGSPVSYTGIDRFESAPAGQPRMKYKDAYKRLNLEGCACKLVPGDPLSALTRVANTLAGTDLLVIDVDGDSGMQSAWRFVPRMLASDAQVFVWNTSEGFLPVALSDVAELAARAADAAKRAA